MEEFEFKDMIRMEINSYRKITVDGLGDVGVLKVPRGWVYITGGTSTFVPERDKRRTPDHFEGPSRQGNGARYGGGRNWDRDKSSTVETLGTNH